MKKMVAGLMALAAVAAVAQAENVYSKNAVGFVNKTVPGGDMVALTIPFVNMESEDGTWDFDSTQLALEAPRGSYVYFWDAENQGWQPESKVKKFATGKTVQPGEAFFFQPSDDMTITISGEVPDDPNTPVAIQGGGGFSWVANPYPVSFEFDESPLATEAPRGSYVYFWDAETQGWQPESKVKKFATGKTVQPGEGFFFQSSADDASIWDVKKEYEFP